MLWICGIIFESGSSFEINFGSGFESDMLLKMILDSVRLYNFNCRYSTFCIKKQTIILKLHILMLHMFCWLESSWIRKRNLITDPDLNMQIISDPGGSGPECTSLLFYYGNALRRGICCDFQARRRSPPGPAYFTGRPKFSVPKGCLNN